MPEIDHAELLAALERRDAPTRALIDLSLRAGYSDADVAGFLGTEEMKVAHWRMNALNELAETVGLSGPTAGTDVALYLLDLPPEAWKRALPRVLDDKPRKPATERKVREPMPMWVRPMPRPRLRDRVAMRLPAQRLPADDMVLMAAAAGVAVAAGLMATTVSPGVLLTLIGAVVLTAILVGRPHVGALALIVLVALFPRSELFDRGLPIAGGDLKMTDALVAATLAAWLLQAAMRPERQRMPGRALSITLLVFLGLAVASLSTAAGRGTPLNISLIELRPLLTLLLIFPIVSCVRDMRQLRLGIAIALGASVLASLKVIFDYVGGGASSSAFTDGGTRVLGTAFQYPMAGTIWALVLFMFTRSEKLRLVLLGVATIDLTAVFFTQQRGAWIALLGSLVCLFVLSPDSRRRQLMLASTGLFVAAAVSLVAINSSSASGNQSVLEAGVQRFLSTGQYDRDVSAGHRFAEWRAAREQIEENPITGIGVGSSITYWSPMYSETRETYGGSRSEFYIHNSYVWFALKLGLPALLAFLALLVIAFAHGVGGYRRARDPDVRLLLTGALTTLVALLILSLSGPHLNLDAATPLVAGTIAVIAVAPALARTAPSAAPERTPAAGRLEPQLG
jgi:O-antigen ligase